MCVSMIFVLPALLVSSASAGLFLAKLEEPELKRVLAAEIDRALEQNLPDVSKDRVTEIEIALRPSFDLLPKSDDDKLDHDGMRYLLSRFFAQKHGWFIVGLQSFDQDTQTSTTKKSMHDHLPELLQDIFEKRIGDTGASLRDVTAFAAMIEHLVRDELRGKLETVYKAKSLEMNDPLSQSQALNLMELYMIFFLRGQYATDVPSDSIARIEKNFQRQYPDWPGLKDLIADVMLSSSSPDSTQYTFGNIADMLEIVADQFAGFYGTQCSSIKSALLDIEDRRSGRVRLVDFYHAALNDGHYYFTETIETLRQYGNLDESDPSDPRIIIPNYLGGQSNCVARTSFYSTCCPNVCEDLLNKVERALGKADATPTEIIAALEDPQAALEVGFKSLSAWLRHRLDDMARHHGGRIPLHGRLFTQWMHFVHPRECQYPHVSGSTSKSSLEQLKAKSGRRSTLTTEQLKGEAQRLTSADSMREVPAPVSDNAQDVHEHISAMWSMEEELFVKKEREQGKTGGRVKLFLLCIIVVGFLVARSGRSDPNSKQAPAWYDKASVSKYTV